MAGIRELAAGFFLTVNVISFTLLAWDKRRAVVMGWRVPEKRLLFLGCIGGALGLYLSMQVFRHKLRKPLFTYGVPLLLALQAGFLTYLFGVK